MRPSFNLGALEIIIDPVDVVVAHSGERVDLTIVSSSREVADARGIKAPRVEHGEETSSDSWLDSTIYVKQGLTSRSKRS